MDYQEQLISATCDAVVFSSKETDEGLAPHVLLVTRKHDPFAGFLALPGGFLNSRESLVECAVRELEEETGLRLQPMAQLSPHTFVDRDPRGRVLSFPFLFVVPGCPRVYGADDALSAEWVDVNKFGPPHRDLNAPDPLAFDHCSIMEEGLAMILDVIGDMVNLVADGWITAVLDLNPKALG